MQYNRLGKAGIKVSALSYGSWVTFSNQVGTKEAKKLINHAFDNGINFFDTAEVYANGEAEVILGKILKDFTREDLVVSTKIYWGGQGPNDEGLSWKHLVEGTKKSLKRLQMDYVDLLFCHRPDPETPIEETVRAMNWLIDKGYAYYWGTSEWSAVALKEAFEVAHRLGLRGPSMEQPQYNLLVRDRVEKEYLPLYKQHGLGTTIWSPLASGALTGKYKDGLPKGGDTARHKWVARYLTEENTAKVTQLSEIAAELGCSMSQLAIAWCLSNQYVSTVILGARTIEQLSENLAALPVVEKLSDEVLHRISSIME